MAVQEIPAIWIQGAGCSGDSVSILNGVAPSIGKALIEELVPGKHLNLRFHPTVMAGSGDMVVEILEATPSELEKGYVLVVEGAVSTGAGGRFCQVGERDGKGIPFTEHVEKLARGALAVIAVGDCAAFGGIPSTAPNPTGAVGVAEFLKGRGVETPVVNLGGCPVNAHWFLGTVAGIMLNGLPGPDDLDPWGRPKMFYGKLIHDNCPRRGQFDVGHFAEAPGDDGCLFFRGCKGLITYADCPDKQWNSGTNWCIRAGAPCMGCAEGRFFDRFGPVYEKITAEGRERLKSAN